VAKKAATKKSTTKKKTTKSTSRKPSVKKTTKKAPAAKKASPKKKTSARKPTAAKTSKKKTTKKAPATKKPSTRKKTTKSAATKESTSKATSSKAPAAKAPAKTPAEPKAAAPKPTEKPTPTRKPSTRKPSASKAKSSKTGGSSGKSDSPSKSKAAIKERWKGSFDTDISSSVSAASKLAAAAGLRPLHERQTSLAATEEFKQLTKTPFKKKDLDRFREVLVDKRRQVTGDVNDMETEALIGRGSGSLSKLPQHMADAGSDTYDQTLNLDLASSQRKLLKEIDDAIARIDNRTFGICELLGKPISKERLENTPWARYSIEGARRKEMLGY